MEYRSDYSRPAHADIRAVVGQLLRKADQNMKDSLYKEGYETALRDVLCLYEEMEKK